MLQLLQIRSIQLVGLSIILLLMLTATNPSDIGVAGITAFFLVLYLWSFVGLKLLLGILRNKNIKLGFDDTHFFPVSLLAGYIPVVMALASISQFSWRDGLIVALAMAALIFYWARRFKE